MSRDMERKCDMIKPKKQIGCIYLLSVYDFITIVSFTKNASHTFYFSFYLNVEINVDGLASVYEKIT